MLRGHSQAARSVKWNEIKVACVTLVLYSWMYELVRSLLMNGKYCDFFPEETHLWQNGGVYGMSWEYVVDEMIADTPEMVCLYKAAADTWLPWATSSSQGLLPDASICNSPLLVSTYGKNNFWGLPTFSAFP